ncbi:hypothetical protein GN956_G5575 [Arapaima gigas]
MTIPPPEFQVRFVYHVDQRLSHLTATQLPQPKTSSSASNSKISGCGRERIRASGHCRRSPEPFSRCH